MSSGGLPLLNGRVSRELKATAAAKGEAAHLSAIKLVSDFFTVRFTSKFSLLTYFSIVLVGGIWIN